MNGLSFLLKTTTAYIHNCPKQQYHLFPFKLHKRYTCKQKSTSTLLTSKPVWDTVVFCGLHTTPLHIQYSATLIQPNITAIKYLMVHPGTGFGKALHYFLYSTSLTRLKRPIPGNSISHCLRDLFVIFLRFSFVTALTYSSYVFVVCWGPDVSWYCKRPIAVHNDGPMSSLPCRNFAHLSQECLTKYFFITRMA